MKWLPGSGSDTISPTAHYTGYVWAQRGLGPTELATWQGRLLHLGLRPVMSVSRAVGTGTVDEFLLARHRVIDHLLDEAIESGQISQIIEIAAGMSPRGYRFAQRYGERITFVEADLPAMAARKRDALDTLGSLGPHHRVVELDALQSRGAHSLHAVAQTLDHGQGLAVLTEGLLNYLPTDSVADLWARIADVCSGFTSGRYLSDLHLSGDLHSPIEHAFIAGLGVFVRGRVHLHFAQSADAEQALRAAGFRTPVLRRPYDFADALPEITGRGGRAVRIIDAHS